MSLFRHLLDVIYPPRCAVCGAFLMDTRMYFAEDPLPFCDACRGDIHPIVSPLCTICGIPFFSKAQEDHPCGECLNVKPHYDTLSAPYVYEGTVLNAICGLKYGGKTFLANALGPLLAQFAEKRFSDVRIDLAMPVPLHKKRLRERGFNQSLLLARHVAEALAVKLDFMSLRRIKYTPPQTGLTRKERHRNIRGAFQLENASAMRDKSVLLVDDVATTGSTLNACAKALKQAGTQSIYCLALARATHA